MLDKTEGRPSMIPFSSSLSAVHRIPWTVGDAACPAGAVETDGTSYATETRRQGKDRRYRERLVSRW